MADIFLIVSGPCLPCPVEHVDVSSTVAWEVEPLSVMAVSFMYGSS